MHSQRDMWDIFSVGRPPMMPCGTCFSLCGRMTPEGEEELKLHARNEDMYILPV